MRVSLVRGPPWVSDMQQPTKLGSPLRQAEGKDPPLCHARKNVLGPETVSLASILHPEVTGSVCTRFLKKWLRLSQCVNSSVLFFEPGEGSLGLPSMATNH